MHKKVDLALDCTYPTDINGIPALMVSHDDPDAKILGYASLSILVHIFIVILKINNHLLMYLKDSKAKFKIPSTTENMLKQMIGHFNSTKTKKQAIDKIMKMNLKNFFELGVRNKLHPSLIQQNLEFIIAIQGGDLYLYAALMTGSVAAKKLAQMKKLLIQEEFVELLMKVVWIHIGKSFKGIGVRLDKVKRKN